MKSYTEDQSPRISWRETNHPDLDPSPQNYSRLVLLRLSCVRNIADRPNRRRTTSSFAIFTTPSTLDNLMMSQPPINIANLRDTTIKDRIKDSNQRTEPEPDDSDNDPGNIELKGQSVNQNTESSKPKC